jgi:hypothetical protein
MYLEERFHAGRGEARILIERKSTKGASSLRKSSTDTVTRISIANRPIHT